MFWVFLALSVSVLALSLATRQRWAAVCAWLVVGNQCLTQFAISQFDPPYSSLIFLVSDCVLAMALGGVYQFRAATTWAAGMFLVQSTVCLLDWGWSAALSLHSELATSWDMRRLSDGYYLLLNILFPMLVACNAWPGAKHVAVHLRDHLHRAGAAGSLARLILRR